MSETCAARRRSIGVISAISAALITSGALVGEAVGTTNPLPVTIGVTGWMVASMAGWAWMARGQLRLTQALKRANQDVAARSEEANRHREKLNAELRQDVADLNHDLSLKVILWLIEHQEQVQSMERSANAMDHALGVADRRSSCPADELAERRVAR